MDYRTKDIRTERACFGSWSKERGKQIRKNFAIPASFADDISDCDFCVDYMLEDCICSDIKFCKNKGCYVPEQCTNC